MEKKELIIGIIIIAAIFVVALNDNYNVVNLTGNIVKCPEGPLDSYRCYPTNTEKSFILQREYQYSTCKKIWFNLESCPAGCNPVTKACNK